MRQTYFLVLLSNNILTLHSLYTRSLSSIRNQMNIHISSNQNRPRYLRSVCHFLASLVLPLPVVERDLVFTGKKPKTKTKKNPVIVSEHQMSLWVPHPTVTFSYRPTLCTTTIFFLVVIFDNGKFRTNVSLHYNYYVLICFLSHLPLQNKSFLEAITYRHI